MREYKDATGTNPFEELSEFAFSILLLPYSNAEVERVFSTMNLVKTKLRNKMTAEMTNSILTIRSELKRCGKDCNTYKFSDDVLWKISTMKSYAQPAIARVEVASMSQEVESDDVFEISDLNIQFEVELNQKIFFKLLSR